MENLSLPILSLFILLVPYLRRHFFSSPEQKPVERPGERQNYFDFIKGLAILAVILIHVEYFFVYYFPEHSTFSFFINNVSRFAVPVFFICSGILLQQNIPNWKTFYWRKIVRILIPYLFVSLMILSASGKAPADFLYLIISGNTLVPYYFIIVLIQFYLIYPLLLAVKNNRSLLFISFAVSLISHYIPGLCYVYDIPLFFPFLFFFVYGTKHQNFFIRFDRQKIKLVWWLAGIFLYLLIFFIQPSGYFNHRLFFGPVILIILFYFKNLFTKQTFIFNFICRLGKISLWIFLIHFPIVQAFFYKLKTAPINFYAKFILVFIISTILSIAVSWFCSWIYKKLLGYFPKTKRLSD